MGYITTGTKGVPLKDIIRNLGNKNYNTIECRCKWVENGEIYDELFGYCQYKNGTLISLDGDTYSLDDLYMEYEEFEDRKGFGLTVWESGEYSEVWNPDVK